MTYGLGGNHNKPGLALAYNGINGRKMAFFSGGIRGGNVDASNDVSNLATRKRHRNVSNSNPSLASSQIIVANEFAI